MNILVALAAVGGLFLVGMLGGMAGMGWLFGIVIPSVALLLFLGGMGKCGTDPLSLHAAGSKPSRSRGKTDSLFSSMGTFGVNDCALLTRMSTLPKAARVSLTIRSS